MTDNQFTLKIDKVSSRDFIDSALEYVVTLATSNHVIGLSNTRLQTEYYIMENLLKGYYIFLNCDSDNSIIFAINKGHNLDVLIEKCRELDHNFLDWLNILPKNKRTASENSLSKDELKEKYIRPEFYTMLEQGQSLKYGGVTKNGKKYKVIISGNPNKTMDEIIKEVISKFGINNTSMAWYLGEASGLHDIEKAYLNRYIPE